MKRIELVIRVEGDKETEWQQRQSVELAWEPHDSWEHKIAHILFTELKAIASQQGDPKHNRVAWKWLDFPNRPLGMKQFMEQHLDIFNSQAIWFELANLVMRAEGDLILAQTFKGLEPAQEPPWEDDLAVNDLWYIHDRKVDLLNQSVYAVIKVQELVNRLLHEALGGDLVDTGKQDWEQNELKRSNVEEGLRDKLSKGAISRADYDAITSALALPRSTPKGEIAKSYRNRLAHHPDPSVDYSMFYPYLDPRVWEEICDARGKVVGRRHAIYAKPPVVYHFKELHDACCEYLDAVVKMLQGLSEIEILRR
jgi:hypothetical protein